MSSRRKVIGAAVVAAGLVGAAQAVVTNYATVEVPAFFEDQWRVWLVLAVLVLLVTVVALVLELGGAEQPVVRKLSGQGASSSRPPAGKVGVLRGRDEELARVMRLVRSPKGRFAVVAGAGGMGKTTLATIAAEQARQQGLAVFWIRWRVEEPLAEQMVEVARTLGLPDAAVAAVQRSGASVPDLVWRHLATTKKWLLVLDNVDQPEALGAGDPVASYRGWIRPGGGLLLVTTRDRLAETWGHAAELIDLTPLTPEQGGQALLDLAPSAGTPEAAQDLSTRLGGLPLALHAAGTALASPTAHLRTFTTYQQALQDRLLPEPPDTTDRETARTLIGHTWELSLDQLADEGHPLARPLLRTLSLLAEAPIPVLLITPALIHNVPDDPTNRAAVETALAQLHRYGLLDTPTTPLPTVALHPLVRETNALLLARDQDPTPWRDTAETALLDLADAWTPQGRPAWPLLRTLTPHLVALCSLESDGDLEVFATARDTLDAVAHELSESGDAATEIVLRHRVLSAEKSILGTEHRDIFTSQNNLANALVRLGRHGEAVELHRRTFDSSVRVLGAEHPDTLTSQNNLAAALDRLGRHGEAVELHRRTLESSIRVLGAEHPDTLTCQNNLANALDRLGRHDEAVELHRRTFDSSVRVLGAEHPSTLGSQNNLGNALNNIGRYGEAAELLRSALENHIRVVGAEHPNTFTSQNNLANALYGLGRHGEAVELHRSTLDSRVRILGAEHPSTLGSQNNLAEMQQALGKRGQARVRKRRVR